MYIDIKSKIFRLPFSDLIRFDELGKKIAKHNQPIKICDKYMSINL